MITPRRAIIQRPNFLILWHLPMAQYLFLFLLSLPFNLSLNFFVNATEKFENGEGATRRDPSPNSVLRGFGEKSFARFISHVIKEELSGCSLGVVIGERDEEAGAGKEQEEENAYVASLLSAILATSNPRQVCVRVKLCFCTERLTLDGPNSTRASGIYVLLADRYCGGFPISLDKGPHWFKASF